MPSHLEIANGWVGNLQLKLYTKLCLLISASDNSLSSKGHLGLILNTHIWGEVELGLPLCSETG